MSRFKIRHDDIFSKNLPPLTINGFLVSEFSDEVVDDLVGDARRCGAGSGLVTVWDHKVRDAWELSVDQITGVDKKLWVEEIQRVLSAADKNLNFGGPVRAQLSKLVIYLEDGHFRSHRDTLRAEGHIATLVVRLRSANAGGELVIGQHRPQKDPSKPNTKGYSCTVFFADTPHEILAVDEGIRVSLVFEIHRDGPATLTSRSTDISSGLTGEIEGGSFAVLRHRYQGDALSTGALVGEDRALAEQWMYDNESGDLVVGELLVFEEGSDYEQYEEQDSIRCRVLCKKRLTGKGDLPPEQVVELSPAAMAYVVTFIKPSGRSYWTGNEATISLFRYRVAVLMRWPRDKNQTTIDAGELAYIYEKAEAYRKYHVAFLRRKLDAWEDPNWLTEVQQRVEKQASNRAPFAQGEIEKFTENWRPPWSHHWNDFDSSIDSFFANSTMRLGAMDLAKIADEEGWNAIEGTILLGALARVKWGKADLDHLSEIRSVYINAPIENLGAHLRELSLTHLTLVDTSLPPEDQFLMKELRTLHVDSDDIYEYDLRLFPNLDVLKLAGGELLEGSGNRPERPVRENGPIRVSLLSTSSFVDVISPRLRQLEVIGWLGGTAFKLADLAGAPHLRILSLSGPLDLSEMPDGLLRSIQRLELLHIPDGEDKVSFASVYKTSWALPVLQHLSLSHFDLSDIPPEFFASLKSLELTNCIGLDALPEIPHLRLLRIKHMNVVLPENVSHRLETLHLVDTDSVAPKCQSLPRLRELYIEKVAAFDLSSWEQPSDLRHIRLSEIENFLAPNCFHARELESLQLTNVESLEMPLLTLPSLRRIHLEALEICVLPDLNALEMLSIHLESLPISEVPRSWSQPGIQTFTLSCLPKLKTLPEWISNLSELTKLVAVGGVLESLPCLEKLHFLHTMELQGQKFRYDEAFVDRINSAPGLFTLYLTSKETDPRPVVQLEAVFRTKTDNELSEDDSDLVWRDDDDDIPF